MMSKSTKKSNDTIVETFKDIIPLSFGEEIGNAASHGVAALLTLLVLPYAAVHSYIAHGTLASVSMSIYVISIFMMFISSTIYHSMQNETPHKYILRIIDHSMILRSNFWYIYAYFVNSCRWLDRLDSIYFIMGNDTLGDFI